MFFLAALAYIAILIEPVLREIILNNLFYLIPIGNFGWTLVHRIICIALWLLCVKGLADASRKNCDYLVFSKEPRPSKTQWTMISVSVTAFIVYCFIDNGDKHIAVISSIKDITSAVESIMMYLLYAVEAILITLIIVFGQKGGDVAFKKALWIPYGGIFLGLCWGIMHFITYVSTLQLGGSLPDALLSSVIMLLYGILFGVFYVLIGKKPLYALPFIAAAFVLM